MGFTGQMRLILATSSADFSCSMQITSQISERALDRVMRYTECQNPLLKDPETGHCSGSFFGGITTYMAVAKAGAPPHSTPYYHPMGWVHHSNCCSGGPGASHYFVASEFANKTWMSTQPRATPMTATALGGRSTQRGPITHKTIRLQVTAAPDCSDSVLPYPALPGPCLCPRHRIPLLSHNPRWNAAIANIFEGDGKAATSLPVWLPHWFDPSKGRVCWEHLHSVAP